MDQNTEFLIIKNLAVLKMSTHSRGRKYLLWKFVNKVNYVQ
jgi:hypothetical protein